MYHYNFTNDLRISTLDEILRDAANAYLTNTVPSASEDKSKNNNYNTVGFYFNLKAKGNCAKLATNGQTKKVVLNFIKKFQYPNPRTPTDYENAKSDGILLAPMRDIVKLLHIFTLINPEESFLTKEEIINFIFYNNDLAKRQNYNLLNTASQIIQYRKDHNFPSNIDIDTSSHEWNQPERQIREMIKTLNYSGCIIEDSDKIKLYSASLSRDREADLFEITNCNTYWNGDTTEDYQKYMDDGLFYDDTEENKSFYEDELSRLYNLPSNKDFAFQSIELLKKYNSLSDSVIFDLSDLNFSKELKCSFSILKKIPTNFDKKNIKDLILEQGGNRYYPEEIHYKNEDYLITNDWYKGTSNHRDNRIEFINYLRLILTNGGNKINMEHSYNRIIFGAPGTGKSHKLEIESESFIKQKSVQTDIDQQIKDEIAAVIKLNGKLNFLAAIGIKYSEQLKTKSRVQLQTVYNLNNVDELYVGSRAKELLPQIQINEEEEDKESQIKEHVKKAQSGDNMLQMLTAIGMKYSDFLSESSMPDLKKTYDLKSDAQMWWLYRGAQAMQALSNESEKKPVKFLERVTFHPNYSYAQFVGTYKPMKSKLSQEEITYEYVPGPFLRIYVNAKRNPEKNFLLLIEEINRSNVAAVFGDVFQLLDRQSDGTSQYPIAASEDQKNYLESCGINEDEISIPSNMYIWATMNSADQGVLPMDAAFKRRWDFEYLGINDNEDNIKDYILHIPHKDSDGNISYTSENWNKIRHAINDKLKNIYGVNEDKLLGPYFLSKSTLDEAKQINCETETDKAEKICSLFKSKVLMYLYEDVVKMNPTELFNKSVFSEDKPLHYSDLCNKFDELGLKIFDEDFIK